MEDGSTLLYIPVLFYLRHLAFPHDEKICKGNIQFGRFAYLFEVCFCVLHVVEGAGAEGRSGSGSLHIIMSTTNNVYLSHLPTPL